MRDSQDSFVFFMPSADLTIEIIRQNQSLVRDYAARTVPGISSESSDDEPLLGRFGLGYLRTRSVSGKPSIESGQRLIAERLYHYLSSLSESPWARDGGSFPVSEYVTDGMITMLGFSSLRRHPDSSRALEVRQLFETLTEEFVDWLANEQNGAFVTPWIEMHLTTKGELSLIAISEDELEDSGDKMESIDEALASAILDPTTL